MYKSDDTEDIVGGGLSRVFVGWGERREPQTKKFSKDIESCGTDLMDFKSNRLRRRHCRLSYLYDN